MVKQVWLGTLCAFREQVSGATVTATMNLRARNFSPVAELKTLLFLSFACAALASARAAVSVGFESTYLTVNETNQSITLNVLRSGDASVAFAVDYETIAREATAVADFVPQSGTLAFAAGETNHVITVPILDDGFVESDESFLVQLKNSSVGVTTNANSLATVVIQDNEKPLIFDPIFTQTAIVDNLITALAPQSDGRLLVFGSFKHINGISRNGLARLNVDGSLDPSFVVTDMPPILIFQTVHLLPLRDGKILLGVNSNIRNDANLVPLLRFNQDGSRDTNFFGPAGLLSVNAVAEQTDGKIVSWADKWAPSSNARSILRFSSDGMLDDAFDPQLGNGAAVTAMALQSHDRLIVAVSLPNTGTALLRFDSTGRRDNSFSPKFAAGADLLSSQIYALFPAKDDKLVISGNFPGLSSASIDAIRINADGTFDSTFQLAPSFRNLPLQAAGAGFFVSWAVDPRRPDYSMPINIVRLTSDGAVDSSFLPTTGTWPFLKGQYFVFTSMLDASVAVAQSEEYYERSQTVRVVRFAADSVNVPAMIIAATNLLVLENATNQSVTIERHGYTGATNSIDYEFSGGTAVPGMDYTPKKGTLTFAPLEVSKQISIPLLDDSIADGRKTLLLRLSNPSTGVVAGTNQALTIYISDDDTSGSVFPDFKFDISSLPNIGVAKPGAVDDTATMSDGKFLVELAYVVRGVDSHYSWALARMKVDGSFDDSFKVACCFPTYGMLGFHLFQPDGKIVLLSAHNRFERQSLFRLNADGSGDSTFVPPSFDWRGFNNISAIVQTDGKLTFAATYYGSPAGVPFATGDHLRGTIVRLNPDGSLDPSLSLTTRTNGGVYSLLQQADGKFIVTGDLFDFGGKALSGLIRLNADGSLDSSFQGLLKPEFNLPVSKMALQDDGKLLLAIYHAGNTNGNPTYTEIQRRNANGTVDTNFPAVKITGPEFGYGAVSALVVQPDRRILVGGTFTHFGELERNGIARLNDDGSVDPTFDPDEGQGPCPTCNRPIAALDLLPDGKIMASGRFTEFAGIPRPGIVRLNNHIQLRFLDTTRSNDGGIKFKLSSPPALTAVLEGSVDLQTWTAVSTNTSAGLYLDFDYAPKPDSAVQFFRARKLAP